MMINNNKYILPSLFMVFFHSHCWSFGTDPVSSFITQGNVVSPWAASVGNGLNWYIPVENQSGRTKRGNVSVSASSKDGDNDALNIKWKGKIVKTEWGGNALYDSSFSLSKHNIDLSSVANAAALVLEIKVLKAPNENVALTMQCQNNAECKGVFPLKNVLRKLPKKTWTYLPIPLACFDSQGNFDFSQVTTALSIATQGKLEISLANVGLAPLPEGTTGCT